jgi:hypothetical protein
MKRQASLETPSFRVWIDPDLPPDKRSESISAILRYCLDPPRPQAERRRIAVRQALGPLGPYRCHAAISRRAGELARRYGEYLGNGWKREQSLTSLPEPSSIERRLLHRIGRLNNGRALCARQFLRIWAEAPSASFDIFPR